MTERGEKKRAERDLGNGNPADYSEALERGLSVLTAFDTENTRLTQADVARRLDLPRATVRRSLMTLVHLGYLTIDGRTYQLTPKVLAIASAYLTANPVSSVLQPACEALCEEFDTSCTVAVLEGADAVMIVRALPRQSIAVGEGLGLRIPAAHSALGRVLLGPLDEEARRRALAAGHRSPSGQRVTADLDQVEAAVAEARDRGYAYAAHEVQPGFHSVAVPLRRWDGVPVAALNIGARLEHLSPGEMLGPVRARLHETADSVRRQLI